MSAESIMARAEIRTGLHRWGNFDFVPRLATWAAAVRSDTGMTDAARDGMDATALRFAEGRLRLEALIAAHPEIEAMPLPAPIVVTGLPRSGTTALAIALARHPGLASLRYGDVWAPFSDEDGYRATQRNADELERLLPGTRCLHDTSAHAHADDNQLQAIAFAGTALDDWQAYLPAWRDRYLAEDQGPAYAMLKRALQAMTFLGRPARWLIKCPQHMEQLPVLLSTFPDAQIVVTVRRRAHVDRSMRRVTGFIGEHQRTRPVPARYWPERFDGMWARYQHNRGIAADLVELPLEDWSRDTDGTCAEIWARANLQPIFAAA